MTNTMHNNILFPANASESITDILRKHELLDSYGFTNKTNNTILVANVLRILDIKTYSIASLSSSLARELGITTKKATSIAQDIDRQIMHNIETVKKKSPVKKIIKTAKQKIPNTNKEQDAYREIPGV